MSCASTPDDCESDRAQEVQAERVAAWRSAQTTRKKYAVVSMCTFGSQRDIQTWFEKQKAAHSFMGRSDEQHRIFVFSADTFGAEADEPWQNTHPCGKQLPNILEFLTHQNGPFDIVLSFDGRCYEDRRVMEPVMRSLRHVSELFMVYQPSPGLGGSRLHVHVLVEGGGGSAWSVRLERPVWRAIPPGVGGI